MEKVRISVIYSKCLSIEYWPILHWISVSYRNLYSQLKYEYRLWTFIVNLPLEVLSTFIFQGNSWSMCQIRTSRSILWPQFYWNGNHLQWIPESGNYYNEIGHQHISSQNRTLGITYRIHSIIATNYWCNLTESMYYNQDSKPSISL